MKKVESGDLVKVKYTCRLETGGIIDTTCEPVAREAGIYNPSRIYEPVEIRIGSRTVLPGFDKAILGMAEGEKKDDVEINEPGGGRVLYFDIRIERIIKRRGI